MKSVAVFASALGLCAWGCAHLPADQARGALPHAEVYQRATDEFAEADFFKPAEPKTNDLISSLAPLILQEVNGGKEPLSRLDRFGTLSLSNGVVALDRARPAIYWQADSVQLNGRAHARLSYLWCYALAPADRFRGADLRSAGAETSGFARTARERTPRPFDTLCAPEPQGKGGPLTPALSPSEGERGNARQLCGESRFRGKHPKGAFTGKPEASATGLPLQGIRVTLNATGQPVIWEVLADGSGAEVIYVSRNLEAAAAAEFGKPLPGRRYTIERSLEEAPNVIVARIIDDGPVAMGPIVYLSAGTRAVTTLICRCMTAQAKRLLSTSTYDLLPFQAMAAQSLLTQARALAEEQTAFWPGDQPSSDQLEKRLRLPSGF